jgi:putative tryptophan/tyrosine transport system substrate-binding protein
VRRREFITLLGGAVGAWPLAARAQQAGKLPTIGFLGANSAAWERASTDAFVQRLRELGWIENRTVAIEYRWAEGRDELFAEIAAEFIRLKVDVILTYATPSSIAAKKATAVIPIVFAAAGDPVGTGLVASLARPGGNITGFTNHFEPSVAGKWVELLKEIAPRLTRVAILLNPDVGTGPGAYFVQPVEAAAATLRMEIRQLQVRKPEDIEPAVTGWAREPNGGLIVSPDPETTANRAQIIALAARHRLPAVYPYRFFLTDGGLISYGIDRAEVFRSAAKYIDRILRGEKPADLPVQLPTKFEMVINLRSAKSLGLQVPDKLLALADELIE